MPAMTWLRFTPLLAAFACAGAPPAGGSGEEPRCPDPKPQPSYLCAQACPPPIAHPNDPPPRYVWADSKHVRDGRVFPCPICLPEGALIATPFGEVPAGEVREGMVVWSRDAAGLRVPARVVLVGATPVVADHDLVRILLSDGRVVS